MKSTKIYVEGEEILLSLSKHAESRATERNVTEYEIYSLIMRLGEQLLDFKNGEEFAVIDTELGNAIVCSVNSLEGNIYVDIITVINNSNVWISRGTKCVKLEKSNIIEEVR